MTFTATNTNYREGGKETIPPEQAGVSYLQGESAPPPVRTDPHSTPTRPTSAEGAEGRGGRGADAGWGGSWAALAENDDGVTVCLMRGEGGPKPKLNPRGFVCFVPIFRASESEVEDDGSSYSLYSCPDGPSKRAGPKHSLLARPVGAEARSRLCLGLGQARRTGLSRLI
jgi:hypothetical protein